ncbi:MAG: hypothetical protein A3G18_12390 [Rhodospirillales bacterium RIFCSPLOWO2_12_FULL_58_28]|nr:MAG: hypothetical protein A3H92_12405 [Rhodospirillales bacterium RIFCSPLOWO2_02_FULL_58_16]OHC79659.1 MAG: hypothetical protein A3G18_12390 [Rhodospirillales bacterium RIFCSPLOWO2_12_FULL_58_28]
MSQVSNLSTTSVVPGNRAPTGLSSIASFERHPIEGISGGVGVSFNDASFRFENEKQDVDDRKARSGGNYAGGRFNAPSQTFAAMFEVGDAFSHGTGYAAAGGRGFVGHIAKAVHVYETTSRVVHGHNNPLGASLSISL